MILENLPQCPWGVADGGEATQNGRMETNADYAAERSDAALRMS